MADSGNTEPEERIFSLSEAQELLPRVREVTSQVAIVYQRVVEEIQLVFNDHEKVATLEEKLDQIINDWKKRIWSFGVRPHGQWYVDFNSGDGYFCWRYGEGELTFWHGHRDGFSGRITIHEWQQKQRVWLQ